MEQKKKVTFIQMITGLLYLASGQRIALGPVRRANDRRWAETVARNQKDLDAEHEAGHSVRFIDGRSQHFKPFSSKPGFKPSTERN